MIRRFGPVLGAGVQVTEQQGEQRIAESALGVTVIVGEFEKGPVDDIQILAGRKDFDARNGARITTSDAPKACQDFYKTGRGSGTLITYRVTAGDEQSAVLSLYTRQGTAAPQASGRKLFGTLTAKNGGRWGGRRDIHLDDHNGAGDITATTLDTGDTMVENEWAGGTLDLKKVTTKTYKIVSNTAAGVISVEADQDMAADFAAGGGSPTDRYVLTRANSDHLGQLQALAIEIEDGSEDPTGEFKLVVYEDGARVKTFDNLSADPNEVNFWETVVNDDPDNHWVVAADLFVGDASLAAVRPANFLGQSDALTATVLTLPDPDVTVNSPGGADPTVAFTYGSAVRSQTVTGTVQNTGADIEWTTSTGPLTVTSVGFTGVPQDLGDEIGTVTVTNGATALVDGDTIVLTILVLEPNEAVGGTVFPDVVNEPNLGFAIDSNTRTTVSVRTGLDLTNAGGIAAGAVFQLVFQQQLETGSDSGPVSDSDFLLAFDPNLSPINKLFGKNLGLVKVGNPGVTSSTVVKAGLAYGAARNYQYRYDVPANVVSESSAIDHVNSTIGRSDYGKVHFPSFGSVSDPDATVGAANVPLKQQSIMGMIFGAEAAVARDFDGYHKAAAGIEVTLPEVLELPTGDPETATVLNEEQLNPQGINVVKFREGVAILWGDKTTSTDSEWQWAHQRELMSHYQNVLRENFDFIIFALNNQDTAQRAATSLREYFLREFTKGALFSEKNQFDGDAFTLKIDSENNTDATRAAGDLNAEISLRLVDTVERFKILIGKQGIFDSVG